MSLSNVLTLIPARGGSRGLPGKNTRPFLGTPLVARTIATARESGVAGRILVSTDDTGIAEISIAAGAEVPFLRPGSMSEDTSPVLAAALHALDWLEAEEAWSVDWLLLLQPTSPLRTAMDIRDAFVILENHPGADAVIAVSETKSHPFWIKTPGPDRFLRPFIAGQEAPARRQDLPAALAVNGMLYLVRTSALKDGKAFCPPKTLPLIIPPSRAYDIDVEHDFLIAEYAASLAPS